MAKILRIPAMRSVMLIMFVSLLVCGCGMSDDGDDVPPAMTVGFTNCYGCHADDNVVRTGTAAVFGDSDPTDGEGWLSGPHGNYQESTSRVYVGPFDNNGFPDYAKFGADPTCAECHDPLGEGALVGDYYLRTGIDALGAVNRPLIGCENCHGGGGRHNGVNPVPYPEPGPSRCAQCHDADFPDAHLPHHPEGDNVFEDYQVSPHTGSINSHVYDRDDDTKIRAKCARCHTDQGARQYIDDVNGAATYDQIGVALDSASPLSAAATSNVQCRTCHDAHHPLKLLGSETIGLPGTWSDEFKTCTSCHQLLNASGNLLADQGAAGNLVSGEDVTSYVYHDPAVNSHGNVDEIITDTHYDDPTTADKIEGYVIDPTSTHSGSSGNTNSGACRDCHNPHDADTTVHNQWAQSAHGGHIATVKAAAAIPGDPGKHTAGVTETEGPAWVHYDFKNPSLPPPAPDTTPCQYCHTATGFRNYANSPATYDPANNYDLFDETDNFVATGEQREMLYCWACHTANVANAAYTDNPYGLRDPGAFSSIEATYTVPAGRTISDLEGSNMCLVCHSGRTTGEYVKGLDWATQISGNNFSGFNSHYLAAGGIIFRMVGYEYLGRDYANSYFQHGDCGTTSAPGTGSNGPCVSCHMETDEGHLFEAVEKDAGGVITAIASEVCVTCHVAGSGIAVTTADLNTLSDGYEAAVQALEDQLAANGIYYGPYPYFYSDAGLTTPYTAWPNDGVGGNGSNTLAAAFNFVLLEHEPGGYAHNQLYAKRLIYDSIDWLDDGTLNSSVAATLGAGLAYEYLKDTRS